MCFKSDAVRRRRAPYPDHNVELAEDLLYIFR